MDHARVLHLSGWAAACVSRTRVAWHSTWGACRSAARRSTRVALGAPLSASLRRYAASLRQHADVLNVRSCQCVHIDAHTTQCTRSCLRRGSRPWQRAAPTFVPHLHVLGPCVVIAWRPRRSAAASTTPASPPRAGPFPALAPHPKRSHCTHSRSDARCVRRTFANRHSMARAYERESRYHVAPWGSCAMGHDERDTFRPCPRR